MSFRTNEQQNRQKNFTIYKDICCWNSDYTTENYYTETFQGSFCVVQNFFISVTCSKQRILHRSSKYEFIVRCLVLYYIYYYYYIYFIYLIRSVCGIVVIVVILTRIENVLLRTTFFFYYRLCFHWSSSYKIPITHLKEITLHTL